jgi:hypothetical protein
MSPIKASSAPTPALDYIDDLELRAGVTRIFQLAQEMIDAGRAEVVVLAARRLACLYKLLVSSGAPVLLGALVISDRCIASIPRETQNVLILDDAVLVGTTMRRLIDEMRHTCPNATIVARSLVEDPDQRADYLLPSDVVDYAALYTRNAAQAERFAKDLVRVLAVAQVPFFADFPISLPSRWSRSQWQLFIGRTAWSAVDVTAPLFADLQYRAYAQIPTEATWAAFLAKLPSQLAELVDAVKLRSYIRVVDDDSLDVVWVPIAMLAPATFQQMTDAFDALPRDTRQALGGQWAASTPAAQHRLLQYLLSLAVYAEIAVEESDHLTIDVENFDSLSVQLSTGLVDSEATAVLRELLTTYSVSAKKSFDIPPRLRLNVPRRSRLLRQDDIRELLASTAELIQGVGVPTRPDPGQLTKMSVIFAHAVNSLFGYIDGNYERRQREAIRQLVSMQEYERYVGVNGRVLREGFTLDDLRVALLGRDDSSANHWSRILISLAIDEGNDVGIIVPVTQFDELRNVAYRCYRLGETAFLANAPLVYHAQPGWKPDEFVSSVVEVVDDAWHQLHTTAREHTPSGFDALRPEVEQAIPGVPVDHLQGKVIEIDDNDFRAFVVNLRDSREIVARFPRTLWSNSAPVELALGRTFHWIIFENTLGSAAQRTSRIRVDEKVTLGDPNRVMQAVRALSTATDGDQP